MTNVNRNFVCTAAVSLAAAAAIVLGSVSATAADTVAADTIKARQQGFKALGAASKTIRDELRDGGDAQKIRAAAIDIRKAADAIAAWFPAGTGPEAGVKTEAKAEIWKDAAGFAKAREAFVREAQRYVQLADAGDIAGLNEANKALGQTCKGCHDSYREKKKE